jgi:hypothetical protein
MTVISQSKRTYGVDKIIISQNLGSWLKII